MPLRLYALAVALVAFASTRSEACTCVVPGPPCASMFLATVFVGTPTMVATDLSGDSTTTFEVSEVLHSKRPLGKTVDVHHASFSSSCGRSFSKEKTYVVYAWGDEQLSTSMCGRTHVLMKDDEDVAFAHGKREETFIDGTVVMLNGGPQARVQVRASGTSITATSDAKGKFRLLVPPGDFAIEVLTKGLRIWDEEVEKISLPEPGACAVPIVNIAVDGRIEGRLASVSGKPVVGLEVFAESKSNLYTRFSGMTDADGKYVIREVPMGTFKVGVSLPDSGGVSPASPYPRTWYPGEVKVDRSGLKTGVDFVLPAALPISKVRGTVKRHDGSIPQGAVVTVVPEGKLRSTSAPVDAKGEFFFEDMTGFEVAIRACEQQRCVDELRILKGDASVQLILPE